MKLSLTQDQVESRYRTYHQRINAALSRCFTTSSPETLYAPARYILEGKGKRIRPFLTLLACEAVSGSSDKALDAALGVEILHNFTLMHDDIMDKADLRHGRPTVHLKWDENTAILSGDMMIAFAYECALRTDTDRRAELVHILNDANITICEGQALDIELEKSSHATIDDYLDMISKKTGRLISAALEAGGVVGNASDEQLRALVTFGEKIGRAFQVQDDYLDIMADDGKSGKIPGGDVINGKKTYLLLRSLELTSGHAHDTLQSIIDNKGIEPERVADIRTIFEQCGVLEEARQLINRDTEDALSSLDTLPFAEERDYLKGFALKLMKRDF
ncbi:polyprenyl synthetase family protein [Prosthecochloris sp. N3]|uniref:Polyprenyl synthetase family protein n=1 Tax=Prosthecochloris ethylica TaxID=2743976 RepID=A0ABR9XS90_9CHLB|nr:MULTISPECIES: polyprenyl synthetase family protein [Prosthecochloris]MEC9487150.1 polyprenyl synthetase family protein [Prosthecochloris sp.]MBF0586844.1 polyprenyl synthetase family protein [Prosthecochloris ethylica]MBF0636808.1 polyprenyl synthetase family protein [Prosthecochloris ethylica]NUK48024.1 polyprenyl synthetase family protein [Prosthecochloris ethylica]RNA64315.1 polyprenyl synthetase family protein [Prosthecochloris sp. ZM_2]